MDPTPILDGPPAFILLGFIVALGAYLRQVSVGAQNLIDEIESNRNDAFPYLTAEGTPSHTEAKLSSLRTTRDSVAKVTPWMFVLMLSLALRISIYAVSHMGWPLPSLLQEEEARRWFDLVVSLSLIVLVLGLWFMHHRARTLDQRVRTIVGASSQLAALTVPLDLYERAWRSTEGIAPGGQLAGLAGSTRCAGGIAACNSEQYSAVNGSIPRDLCLRSAVCCALVHDPPILLLDDPTADLDQSSAERLIEWLQEVAHEKLIIVATNDSRIVQVSAQTIHLPHAFPRPGREGEGEAATLAEARSQRAPASISTAPGGAARG